jgi:chromosome segregation ATPase
MAKATGKARCITCDKEKSTVRCDGCSQPFCYNHLVNHRQELSKQLDEIEVMSDLFRQTLLEHTEAPEKHACIKQIDEWERDSIEKIRETAEEARQILLKHTTRHFTQMEHSLNKLSNQFRDVRQEDDFFETDLRQWTEQLIRLREELHNPSIIKVKYESIPLVNKVSVDVLRKYA